MASATVQISYFGESATTPAGSSGESTGMCFNLADSRSGTANAISIPTTTAGTAYSYPKFLALEVVATGTTSISNRQVARSSSPPAGIIIYWGSTSIYTQPAAAVAATNTTADNADPDGTSTGWTAMTTSYVAYSTASVATSTGRNGDYLKLAIGVSSTGTYTGGPGSAISLPNITISYDEA